VVIYYWYFGQQNTTSVMFIGMGFSISSGVRAVWGKKPVPLLRGRRTPESLALFFLTREGLLSGGVEFTGVEGWREGGEAGGGLEEVVFLEVDVVLWEVFLAGEFLKTVFTVEEKIFSVVGRREEGLGWLRGRIMDSEGFRFSWLESKGIGVWQEGWLESCEVERGCGKWGCVAELLIWGEAVEKVLMVVLIVGEVRCDLSAAKVCSGVENSWCLELEAGGEGFELCLVRGLWANLVSAIWFNPIAETWGFEGCVWEVFMVELVFEEGDEGRRFEKIFNFREIAYLAGVLFSGVAMQFADLWLSLPQE
jgi:hypothetical protein